MNSPITETPVRVRLVALSELAPTDLGDRDFRSWLTAPIAGEPLYKRILHALLPLRILELTLEPGRAGETILQLFRERPIYNLKARMARHPHAASTADAPMLVLPMGGLLEAELTGMIARGQRNGRIERTPVNISGSDNTRRAEILYLPPGHSDEEIDPSTPPQDEYLAIPPILRPTNTSVALRELAQRALESDLGTVRPVGVWRDDLLLGEGAIIDPQARTIGKTYVGAGSRIEARAVLGPGTTVGENCIVRSGAHLTHALVLDGSEVGPGVRLLGGVWVPSGELV